MRMRLSAISLLLASLLGGTAMAEPPPPTEAPEEAPAEAPEETPEEVAGEIIEPWGKAQVDVAEADDTDPYDDEEEAADDEPSASAGEAGGGAVPADAPDLDSAAHPGDSTAPEPSLGEPAGVSLPGLPPKEVDAEPRDRETAHPPPAAPSEPGSKEGERVGFRQGKLFIRDHRDRFRLYPGGRLRTDFQWTPAALDIGQAAGGNHFAPRLIVRRVQLQLAGEMFKRLGFTLGIELGGQRIGQAPALDLDGSRFAPALAHDGRVRPAEVSVSYRFRRWLSFTVGQFNAPFSMSNRTRETLTPFMERNLAIRGFAVPYEKELGLAIWGELFGDRTLAYEFGIFSGDGPEHLFADDRPELIGRLFARPLTRLGENTFFRYAQIGMSFRHGQRDQAAVAYDYPSIGSDHGFMMWRPGYRDSHGRTTHVLPSGAQNAIGGELRLPFALPFGRALDVRGEAYFVVNNTREAVAGYQLSNTERFGRVKGLGWYGQVSYWACGDAFVSGEPGIYRPAHVDLGADDEPRRGLEVLGRVAGISANYAGATRYDSVPDANTPTADISIYQFGLGAQYWYTSAFRAAVNYTLYWVPGSGDPSQNQAMLPDALDSSGQYTRRELMHEIGTRLAVSF